MILGIHGSIRSGYQKAIQDAEQLKCEALQIFSYRRHHDPGPKELLEVRDLLKAGSISRLLVHVRYLPSLASSDPARRQRSVELLAREMRLASLLGAQGLILHAGAYSPGSDLKSGLSFFAEGALAAQKSAGLNVPLLLENVPGGGRRMGGPLEELAELGGLLISAGLSVGYCLDTAHAWAQGYDISSERGMGQFLDLAIKVFEEDRIHAFHLNDTLAEMGSHRENHWHWEEGRLGYTGLQHLLQRQEFLRVVGILETPQGERDAANLRFVRKFCVP